jgi:hypothetical protein
MPRIKERIRPKPKASAFMKSWMEVKDLSCPAWDSTEKVKETLEKKDNKVHDLNLGLQRLGLRLQMSRKCISDIRNALRVLSEPIGDT